MKNFLPFKSKPAQHSEEPAYDLDPGRILDLLLIYSRNQNNSSIDLKRHYKVSDELSKLIEDLHVVLRGNIVTFRDPRARIELRKHLKENNNEAFRLLMKFPKLDWRWKIYVFQIVASLLKQQVVACKYVEENLDIVVFLINGLFDSDDTNDALLYGLMLRECILQSRRITKYVLHSEKHMKRFLDYVQHPNYTLASHVKDTLDLLLTSHRSTVTKFLLKNYDWFFAEFNSKLLESHNELTKWHAHKLLGEILLDQMNYELWKNFAADLYMGLT